MNPETVQPSRTAYETCPTCGGSGLQMAMDGVTECYECEGNSVVRARDPKGRFTTRLVLE